MSGPRLDRRQLMKGSTAVVALAAMGPVALFSGRPARAAETAFSQAYFDQRVGATFHVDTGVGGGWNALELVEVIPNDAAPQLDQFTARFRGSPNIPFDEGLYDVAAPEGEGYALYVQPAGSDAYGAYYEATFGLMRPLNGGCAG